MAFNTTSYLAGIGSVVAVISTGFAGGYLLAKPGHVDPPNRLQRLAAQDQTTRSVMPVSNPTKPEVVAEASATAAPSVVAPSPPVMQPNEAAVSPPVATPVEAKAPAIVERAEPDRIALEKANADRARATEARVAEKKRSDARKIAEQQRKQKELEVATIAVRRIIHDRDAQDVADNDPTEAPAPEMPRFNLFGRE